MTFQELTLPIRGKVVADRSFNKKQTRKVVRIALSLYQEKEISKDMLAAIAEMALALEIASELDAKLEKKANRF